MGQLDDTIFPSCTLPINSLGILVNFFAVVAFLRVRRKLLDVNNNKFLLSMAVADCLVSLFGIVGTAFYHLYKKGIMSKEIWKLCGALPLFGSFYISILSLGVMTADRLIAVVYALRYHSIMTEFRAKLLVCLTWITVAIILINQGTIYMEFSSRLELNTRSYELLVVFLLGALVLCIGNLKLYFVIRSKLQNTVYPAKTTVVSQTKTDTRLYNNYTGISSDSKICLWMTISFLICWLPVTIDYIAYINGYVVPKLVYTLCMSTAALDTLLTPLIYLVKRKEFRQIFYSLFTGSREIRGGNSIQ